MFSIDLNQLIYGCGVFPLVKVAFFRDCAVDAVEDLFADFAYLGLRRVDESAGRFVCEVWFVVLKCYECVFVGCSVHSIVDSIFRICNRYINPPFHSFDSRSTWCALVSLCTAYVISKPSVESLCESSEWHSTHDQEVSTLLH